MDEASIVGCPFRVDLLVACNVIGMNVAQPRLFAFTHLFLGQIVTDCAMPVLIPGDGIGGEVVFPHRQLSCIDHMIVTVLGLAQRDPHLLLRINIKNHADVTFCDAGLIPLDHLAALVQPAPDPVARADPVFDGIRIRQSANCVVVRTCVTLNVVGVNSSDPVL